MRITQYLIADHERLHPLLERCCEEFEPDLFARFRAGLLRHIAIEEKILFPAASGVLGRLRDFAELHREHSALAMLLVPPPDAALCREIATILADHNQREEGDNGVYEQCERLLPSAESLLLGEKATQFPQVKVAPHSRRPGLRRTAAEALAAATRTRYSTDENG
jgi:hypothetical protein